MQTISSYLLLLLCAASAHANPFTGNGHWVDLTHELSAEAIFWPTAEPFELITDAEGFTDQGYYYSAYSFKGAEHGGTHIDAPIHFAANRQTVDQIPLSRLIGNAVVVDVTSRAAGDRNYRITVSDLAAFEREHGAVNANDIVLLRTGFSQHWPDAKAYLGTAKRGPAGVEALQFPGLHPAAADWLVQRGISSVGIDTASIDYGRSTRFSSHVALMTANIPALENLTNLDQLPPRGAFLVALPTKIKGGSGGPVRVVAWVPR